MGRKSKIETSEHYNEIVDLLVAGYSGRHVSDYLEEEYGEKISHASLNNYKKNKLNVKAAVKEKIIKREKATKKAVEEAVNKQVDSEIKANESFTAAVDYMDNDIQKLDNLINDTEKLKVDIGEYNEKSMGDKFDPSRKIELELKYKRLGLDAMKIKHNILVDKDIDVTIHNEPLFDEEYFNRILEEEK